MIKLLIVAAVICALVRWLTGMWPWQWLSTQPSRTRDIAKARRLLQVSPAATPEDVRAAYRRLAAEIHPDRGGSTAHLAALTEARDLILAQLPETPR